MESEDGGRDGNSLMEKLAQGGEEREAVGWEQLRIVMGRGKRASGEGEIRGRRRRGGGPRGDKQGTAGLRREKVLANHSGPGRGAGAEGSAPQRPLFSLLSRAQVACLAREQGAQGGSGRTAAARWKGKEFGDHSRGC